MFACVYALKGNLLALAECFSPVVEQTTPDAVVFAIKGLEQLLGSTQEIASAICRQGDALGIRGRLAIAQNPDTAVLVARHIAGVTIIPPGSEPEYLDELPVEALNPPPEILATLASWGIHKLGVLGALPEIGLAERFGQEGVRLRRLALGCVQRQLRMTPPAKQFAKHVDLEDSITLLEPLLFILSSVLHELTENLQQSGLATNRLDLVLELDDKSRHQRTQEFASPLHDTTALLKIVHLDLQKHPPRAAIVGLYIELQPAKPQTLQHDLYIPAAPAPQQLQLALQRIVGLVGANNVGSPYVLDTHRPDAIALRPFAPPKPTTALQPITSSLQLAFRRYRPALPATVQIADDKPIALATAGIRGTIQMAAGPWRSIGEWWTTTEWARDEWDIDLSAGGVYRIFYHLRDRHWFVDGIYD